MRIIDAIAESQQIEELAGALKGKHTAAALFGAHRIHRAVCAAAFALRTGEKVIAVFENDADAFRSADDIRALGFERVEALPSREITLLDVESVSRDEEVARLSVLGKAAKGELDIICCSVEALCLLTIPHSVYLSRLKEIRKGDRLDQRELAMFLVDAGYTRTERVEGRGQYAVRGDIIDLFPADRDMPLRIELFGDEVDRISEFSPDTQRRSSDLTEADISPAREISFRGDDENRIEEFCALLKEGPLRTAVATDLQEMKEGILPACPDRYLNICYEKPETVADYLPDSVIFISEPVELEIRYKNLMQRHTFDLEDYSGKGLYTKALGSFYADMDSVFSGHDRVLCETFTRAVGERVLSAIVNINSNTVPRWGGEITVLTEDLSAYRNTGYRCVVFAGTGRAAEAVSGDLTNEGFESEVTRASLPAEGHVAVTGGSLSSGFEFAPLRIAVITSFNEERRSGVSRRQRKPSESFGSLEDLKPGDYVVHRNHGIGVFDGIKRIDHHGYVADYITLRYRDGDMLYVPVTSLDMVSPYISGKDDAKVTLNKLNSGEWQKTKQKVYRAVREMAKELIELYAKRESTEGISFSADTEWQRDFEARFPYEETEDQLRSAEEIKKDMESRKPMDRLLCGDVGVGKTEVALRAAFKCVSDGYQVAILVPTTILAWQHYQTVTERMDPFPIRTALLSRFADAKAIKAGVAGIKNGTVDIAIGTHRLLQKDIEFKKLGLLIVDEEQRFGVAHKEKLKEKFPGVDVLTLSATPIPRTLNMAMSGIRDMSTIENPPVDRHPVQTYVTEYDRDTVRNAIRREMSRGGQVYYLHNRVETIDRTAAQLQEMVPEARIEIAHGQMNEQQLSEVWRRMVEGECDVLVCTTIIETGVDISNCNTLIIEDADNLGLAQLYQLRGRVGRSSRRAYAWLLFRKDKVLNEISAKRLAAIRDFTAFGSGFKIAMRDLQIRGAGSVLSARQSGHIQNVGYETYIRILEQAVSDEQGIKAPKKETECRIDLPISAYIPDDYIEDIESRIEMYKRIADVTCKEEYDEVVSELRDRFGSIPECVRLLCSVSSARANAAKLGFYEIRSSNGAVLMYIDDLNEEQLKAAAKSIPGRVFYSARGKKYLTISDTPADDPLPDIFTVLDALRELKEKESA